MKLFFDTEFIEDGKTIDFMSIGIVAEDGREYYAESSECDLDRASDWVKEHVIPHLRGGEYVKSRKQISEEIYSFAGHRPEFWAWYGCYDWVALCQLYGPMIKLPSGWPYYTRDIRLLVELSGNPSLPKQSGIAHHALADAQWNKEVYDFLMKNEYYK